jgi:hypothetical protein
MDLQSIQLLSVMVYHKFDFTKRHPDARAVKS